MPPHTIPRRSFTPHSSEPVPINWRRGLLRIWMLVSAAWIMSWIIYLIMFGLQGGFKAPRDLLAIPVLLIGPPIALLIFGLATRWAFQGFKTDDQPPSG